MSATGKPHPTPAGLTDDPVDFMVFTEIAIIAHLADTGFARVLPPGLTTAQFGVLNHLIRKGHPQTVSAIAAAMQVSPPTMSSTVRRLEDAGLVRLLHDPDDRRIRRVEVTTAGHAMREAGIAAAAALRAQWQSDLTPDEWRTALKLLARIRATLDAARD